MKSIHICHAFVVSLLVLLLTSCGAQATPPAEPTATVYAYPPPMYDPEEVAASLTAVPDVDDAAPAEVAENPTPTEELVQEPLVDNCVDCHTDQQALIDTADPVAEVVSENEGEG